MLHPSLNPKSGGHWMKPESMEEWKDPSNTTIKLDIVAQVVLHHLERNGRAPLMAAENGRTLLDEPNGMNDDGEYTEDDRIIIYSAFPSSNQAIIDVSHSISLHSLLSHILCLDSYTVRHRVHRTPWESVLEETSRSVKQLQGIDSKKRPSCADSIQRRHGRFKFGLCQHHVIRCKLPHVIGY